MQLSVQADSVFTQGRASAREKPAALSQKMHLRITV
jgi:hypothetical protein